MCQSQILPPGSHFVGSLISTDNFWLKKYFLKNKHRGWTKSTPEKYSFDYSLHFLTKKNISFAKIWNFWGFLKFSSLVAKSKIGTYIILHYFPEYLTPMLTLDPQSYRNGKFRGWNSLCELLVEGWYVWKSL